LACEREQSTAQSNSTDFISSETAD